MALLIGILRSALRMPHLVVCRYPANLFGELLLGSYQFILLLFVSGNLECQ